jgi:redox-sensitive bicupin YhaK (pirin superfamily)
MSMTLRPANSRGHADYGWLDTYHSFSFADYLDPVHMGFRSLRVINDDVVKPEAGFDTHGHRDMEIITYVVRGALAHQDTTGGNGVLNRGDVQYMSAGTGLRHSEFNASAKDDVRLLQIWILPLRKGLAPSYTQTTFPDAEKRNRLRLIAAPGGPDGALSLYQDAHIHATILDRDQHISHHFATGRGGWIQVVDGDIKVNGIAMASGDGLSIQDETMVRITATSETEFLLFDLA